MLYEETQAFETKIIYMKEKNGTKLPWIFLLPAYVLIHRNENS